MLQSCSSGDSNNSSTTESNSGGNVYSTVLICNQTWMKSNLSVSNYRNGDVIPQITDQTQWKNTTTGAWCYPENNSANGSIYGKLYNWYAVNDPRGLAPTGWHIPSRSEWVSLENCLGGDKCADKLKEAGTLHWISPNATATNSSGFTALPISYRGSTGEFSLGGRYSIWWSSTQDNSNAYASHISYNSDYSGQPSLYKWGGFSVRCVKD